MKKTCLQCDTELTNELLEGFEVHSCPNCQERFCFGIDNHARLLQHFNDLPLDKRNEILLQYNQSRQHSPLGV
jgi:Zn-finger nucleic acid-binding protein